MPLMEFSGSMRRCRGCNRGVRVWYDRPGGHFCRNCIITAMGTEEIIEALEQAGTLQRQPTPDAYDPDDHLI